MAKRRGVKPVHLQTEKEILDRLGIQTPAVHCDVRIGLAGPAGGAEERRREGGAPTPAFSPRPGTAQCCSHPRDSLTLLKLALRLGLLA